ncbi:IclR family transcriptional regulator domain-containing protein [Brevibacterium paucivorans]
MGPGAPIPGIEEAGSRDGRHEGSLRGDFVGEHAPDAGAEQDQGPPIMFYLNKINQELHPVFLAHRLGVGRDCAAAQWQIDSSDVQADFSQLCRQRPQGSAITSRAMDHKYASRSVRTARSCNVNSVTTQSPPGLFWFPFASCSPSGWQKRCVRIDGHSLRILNESAILVISLFAVECRARFSATILSGVRRRGWAQSIAERERGVASVSAPVRGPSSRVVVAVSISGPVERLTRQPGRLHAQSVLEAVKALTDALNRA